MARSRRPDTGGRAYGGGQRSIESSDGWLATTSAHHQTAPPPRAPDPDRELYYPPAAPTRATPGPTAAPPYPPATHAPAHHPPPAYPPPRYLPPVNGQPGPALIPPDPPMPPPPAPAPAPDADPPRPTPPPRPGIDPDDARALAAMFAANALSGEETQADKWHEVLAQDFGLDLRALDQQGRREMGIWDCTGRQRVDQAHPGAVAHLDPDHATVRVRVQITPYTPLDDTTPSTEHPPEPDLPPHAVRSTVPPAADPRWQGHDAYLLQLAVPVARRPDGTLVIDPDRFAGDPQADGETE